MTKREFLAAGIGAGLALNYGSASLAQGGKKLPARKAKTTKLCKSPLEFPNALSVTPDGLWIGERKLFGDQARAYNPTESKSLEESACMVDMEWETAKDSTCRTFELVHCHPSLY